MECAEPFKIEALIKRVFNEKFRLIAGKEYFEGNETDMKTNFIEIVTNYKPREKSIIPSLKYIIPSETPNILSETPNIPSDNPIIPNKNHIAATKGLVNAIVCKKCDKMFSRTTTFKNHIGKCKGNPVTASASGSSNTIPETAAPGKVTCSMCNKQFANKYSLQRHVETVCEPNQVKSILMNPIACKLLKHAMELGSGN